MATSLIKSTTKIRSVSFELPLLLLFVVSSGRSTLQGPPLSSSSLPQSVEHSQQGFEILWEGPFYCPLFLCPALTIYLLLTLGKPLSNT